MGIPSVSTKGDTTVSKNVTATLYEMESSSQLHDSTYHLRCQHGEDISANPGDYWTLPDSYVFTCACEGEDTPLEFNLVRDMWIVGENQGQPTFYGKVTVRIKEGVTVGDLRGLKG